MAIKGGTKLDTRVSAKHIEVDAFARGLIPVAINFDSIVLVEYIDDIFAIYDITNKYVQELRSCSSWWKGVPLTIDDKRDMIDICQHDFDNCMLSHSSAMVFRALADGFVR
jgi:hypothetical protein